MKIMMEQILIESHFGSHTYNLGSVPNDREVNRWQNVIPNKKPRFQKEFIWRGQEYDSKWDFISNTKYNLPADKR